MGNNQDANRGGKFRRRDMLKAITAVPAAALIPLGSATNAEGKTPPQAAQTPKAAAKAGPVVDGYHLQALTEHEYRTVKVLSDLIIPADERSGSATQAGVPQFIDDWLNFKRGNLLAEIRGGLLWMDLQCQHHYGHRFIECPPADQKKMLDRIAYPDKAAPADANYVTFFNQMRALVVEGFFSSEMGVKDLPYLGNKFVPVWKGCPPNVLAQINKNLAAKGIGLRLPETQES